MDYYQRYFDLIDKEKTITECGPIENQRSKVFIVCKNCGLSWKTCIKSIRQTLSKHPECFCPSCRIKVGWTDDKKLEQSKRSKKMWNSEVRTIISYASSQFHKNPENRKKSKQQALSLWQKPEYREKVSEAIKLKWEDLDYSQAQSRKSFELWTDAEYRKLVTESNVNTWKDILLRRNHGLTIAALWENEDYRKSVVDGLKRVVDQLSRSSKNNWLNKEYRDRQSEIIKERYETNLVRDKIAEASRKMWSNTEFKVRHSRLLKKIWENPDLRKKQSLVIKELWKNVAFQEKQAKARSDFLISGNDSIIERISQQILGVLEIEYQRHYVIGPYEFDLFIPSHHLLIECQGEYWHSSEKVKSKNASKFTYVDKYFPQYRVLYLYERDFLNPGIIKQKLIKELFDEDQSTNNQIDFRFEDLTIKELSVKEKLEKSFYSAPEEFLQSFHYAGYGRSAKKIYGAYLGEELISICKFTSVIRQGVATSMQYSSTEVLELDRFCIHPQYQKKNLASWFISRCSKITFQDEKIKCLVSFADSTYGHSGIIYKAANWKEVGQVKPDYHYLDSNGWVLHKKTLYNHAQKMGKLEREYAEDNGYLKVYGKEKTKFMLIR